jgi:hypothetical protein
MSSNGSNRISNPRLLAALRDPGVDLIEEAARKCDAAGHRRANLIASRVKWPKFYMELLDEMRLHGVPDAQILEFCECVAEAGRQRVYGTADVPVASVSEAFAKDAEAEAEVRQNQAHLIHDRSPSRWRAVWASLLREEISTRNTRMAVARQMQQVG